MAKTVYLISVGEAEAKEMADAWYNRRGWVALDVEMVADDALFNIFELIDDQLHEVLR